MDNSKNHQKFTKLEKACLIEIVKTGNAEPDWGKSAFNNYAKEISEKPRARVINTFVIPPDVQLKL